MTPDENKQRLEEALGRSIVEERIDKSTLVPLNDGNHTHEYIEDPTDETDEYRSVICKHCPVGRLIKKL